jgi:hypothetical protein
MGFATPWGWIESLEIMIHLLIYFHYSCLVTTPITVIRCRENCDYCLVVTPVVSIHNQLMGSCYQLQIIRVIKVLGDILSKCETSTTWRYAPTMSIIRIRPKEITHRSFVGHLNESINLSYLLECIKVW